MYIYNCVCTTATHTSTHVHTRNDQYIRTFVFNIKQHTYVFQDYVCTWAFLTRWAHRREQNARPTLLESDALSHRLSFVRPRLRRQYYFLPCLPEKEFWWMDRRDAGGTWHSAVQLCWLGHAIDERARGWPSHALPCQAETAGLCRGGATQVGEAVCEEGRGERGGSSGAPLIVRVVLVCWARGDTSAASQSADSVTASAASVKEGVVANRDKVGDEVTEEVLADTYDRQQQFRDLLAIKCSHPRFFVRHLCINRLATFVYKCLYFYLWVVLLSLIVQGYLLFRSWVNPPARMGLKNLEERLLHVPRVLFAGCVYGVAWLVRAAQPVIDPVVNFLNENFPQINWGAASAEKLASKAEHFADDTHPKMKIRRQQELEQQKLNQERRDWIGRVLLVLFALFSLLCVL